jgi:uncharacterized protein
MPARRGLVGFVSILQTVMFLGHFLVYETWTFALAADTLWLKVILSLLSVTFISAAVLSFRSRNVAARAFYTVGAVWTGFLSFFFFASVFAWVIFAIARVAGLNLDFHRTVQWLFSLAAMAALYAVFNANWTRITRIGVQLANLPPEWRGRKVALISDLHLGHVRNGSFLRRMVQKIIAEKPSAIFIAGDLFDGTAIDARRAAEPLRKLSAPHGVYFVAGNHEQFGDDSKYLGAVAGAGVRVLNNEKVEVDGLQIAGVPYHNAVRGQHFASVLESLSLDRDRASILLVHAPDHPAIAEAAGFSLQLSGHTHLGQFLPWSWGARRVYRQFVYGLSRIGAMQVFTSSGAGTWGPPLRLGSKSEIVLLQLE